MLLTFYRKIMIYNRVYILLFGADILVLNQPSVLIKSGNSYWKDANFSLNQAILWNELSNNILLAACFSTQVQKIFAHLLKQMLTDDERLKFHPKALKMLTSVFSQDELKAMVHAEKKIKTSICEILEYFNYDKTIQFLQWLYFRQIEDDKIKQRVFKRFKITKTIVQDFSSLSSVSEDYLNDSITQIIQNILPSTYNIFINLKQESNSDNE